MEPRVTHTYADGSTITGPAGLVAGAITFERSEQAKQAEWTLRLSREGVKAAHPDDGWVDREANTVTFCYPFFDDSPAEGDLIALGWHDKYRLVRVTDVRTWGLLVPMTTYSFVQES